MIEQQLLLVLDICKTTLAHIKKHVTLPFKYCEFADQISRLKTCLKMNTTRN